MQEAGLVGVGAAIIIDRRIVWTNMNIKSISKTFTGVALMQAVEEGSWKHAESLVANRND
jgi:CubicO group peptidase (beta-lactamase class C family)